MQGLIKIVNSKDWLNVFDIKTLKQIEKVFAIHFKRNAQNFNSERDYLDNLKQNPFTIHVDTGDWDDTCGIRPKQIKLFIKKIGLKYLSIALDKAQKEFNSLNSRANYREYSEDHNHTFYDFNAFWKTQVFTTKMINNYKKSEKDRIKKEAAAAKLKEFNQAIDKIRYGEKFYNDLPKSDQNLIFELFSRKGYISKGILFKVNKNKWKKEQGFIPKAEEMLIIDPKKFNKEPFLKAIDKLYKTKQLTSLPIKDREAFIDLYLVFGNDLHEIPFHLLSSKENLFFFDSMALNENASNKAFLKLIRNLGKGIIPNITLIELSIFNFILSSNKSIYNKFMSNTNIFWKDIESIISIGEFSNKLKEAGYIELIPYLMKVNKNSLENIFKLNYKLILDLFDRTKEDTQILPTCNFKIKDYQFEVIDKSDIRGMICGYPFSCQYIGGVGAKFTKYGYNNNDSSFMIVSKKGVIVAQSWIWKKDSQVTFDSIEWKGNLSRDIIKKGYEAYADIIIDKLKCVETITVGNCHSIFTDHINKFIKLTNTEAGYCYDSERQFLVKKRNK